MVCFCSFDLPADDFANPNVGLQKERVEQRDRIEQNRGHINVIVTTYQTASGNQVDSKFLRCQKPVVSSAI
jgi:hypothetical protein